MSHHVKQQLPVGIKNLRTLKLALKNLNPNLTLDMTAKRAKFYGNNTVACDGVIRLKGCEYEISLQKEKDGTYTAGGDLYHNELRRVFSRDETSSYGNVKMERLSAEYRAAELQEEAEAAGYTFNKMWDPEQKDYAIEIETPEVMQNQFVSF